MSSNEPPGESGGDYYDDGHWEDCHDCGGDGFRDDECECNAFEDTCMCLNPKPPRCSTCKGRGGWTIDYSAEDQALHEADQEAL